MSLCKYKNIFGIPGEGAHRYRIFNIAIVDVVMTIIAAIIISKYIGVSFWKSLLTLFLLSILLHRIFCVKTTIDILLFK